MFIGSFFRVRDRTEAERAIPTGTGSTIIFIETENKLYEKNRYGMLLEYNLGLSPNAELDKRLTELETAFKKLNEELGGTQNEI